MSLKVLVSNPKSGQKCLSRKQIYIKNGNSRNLIQIQILMST